MLIQDQFGIKQNLQMSPIAQTIFLAGTFFSVSYSKPASINVAAAQCLVSNKQPIFHKEPSLTAKFNCFVKNTYELLCRNWITNMISNVFSTL